MATSEPKHVLARLRESAWRTHVKVAALYLVMAVVVGGAGWFYAVKAAIILGNTFPRLAALARLELAPLVVQVPIGLFGAIVAVAVLNYLLRLLRFPLRTLTAKHRVGFNVQSSRDVLRRNGGSSGK